MATLTLSTDSLLQANGMLGPATLVCEGEKVAALEPRLTAKALDARGFHVLPGIVDFHGDAFERQIMPRPKTLFPLDIALRDTDTQLLANGITTAYHGLTVSWEPGLRSLPQALNILKALDDLESTLHADHRIQIRWETFAVDEVPEVIALFAREKKPTLAFNDHTTPSLAKNRSETKLKGSADRACVSLEEYRAVLGKAGERVSEVDKSIREIAAAARKAGVTMLSHDDDTDELRHYYRDLGAKVCEFPMNWKTAELAKALGDPVVMGAPNVVRGGSHNGMIAAEDAVTQGICTILASDYYYPAPLSAAFRLADSGRYSLGEAWNFISRNAALACGLEDRGLLQEGLRADAILVNPKTRQVAAAIVAGKLVFQRDFAGAT